MLELFVMDAAYTNETDTEFCVFQIMIITFYFCLFFLFKRSTLFQIKEINAMSVYHVCFSVGLYH
jgi:hypothetical protein